jgi:hypothetical protein
MLRFDVWAAVLTGFISSKENYAASFLRESLEQGVVPFVRQHIVAYSEVANFFCAFWVVSQFTGHNRAIHSLCAILSECRHSEGRFVARRIPLHACVREEDPN